MYRMFLIGLLAIGLLSTGGLAGTAALFTDTQSVGANTFTTGTLDLTALPATAIVTFSAMAPGDDTVGAVTVTNGGTLQMRYAITSSTTENTLAALINLTVWDEAAEAVVDGSCDANAPASVLYGPADIGSTAGIDVVGDPTSGAQAGDRTINASANEVLCLKAELPLATDNTAQGLTTTATLNFQAEQTANN